MGALKLKAFDIVRDKQFIVIFLNGSLDIESSHEFSEETSKFFEPAMNVIFNCEHLTDVCSSWIRALVQLNQSLSGRDAQMRFINVSSKIASIFVQEGVGSTFKINLTLRAALADLGLVSNSKFLDVNFVNAFLEATSTVLETQTFTVAKPGKLYRRDAKDKFLGDISGMIDMTTDTFSGLIVISFPSETFLKIMSRMLSEELTKIDHEIESGAGELANMIFGQAKVVLNKQGFGIKTALPTMCVGPNQMDLLGRNGLRITVPFETDIGIFNVEIGLTE